MSQSCHPDLPCAQTRGIGEAALQLASGTRRRLPVEGEPWCSEAAYWQDPQAAVMEVLCCVHRLENVLNPTYLPFQHPARGVIHQTAGAVRLTPELAEVYRCAREVLVWFNKLLEHYCWEGCSGGFREEGEWCFEWRGAWPIARAILDGLEHAGADLLAATKRYEEDDLLSVAIPVAVSTGTVVEVQTQKPSTHEVATVKPPDSSSAGAPGNSIAESRPTAPVVLGKPGETVYVLGKPKRALKGAKYDVIKALLAAPEWHLSGHDLDTKSGRQEARKYLKQLAAGDEDWRAIIRFPGKGWAEGYGLHFPR